MKDDLQPNYDKYEVSSPVRSIRGPFKIIDHRRAQPPKPRPTADLEKWCQAGLPKLLYKDAMVTANMNFRSDIGCTAKITSGSTVKITAEEIKSTTHYNEQPLSQQGPKL